MRTMVELDLSAAIRSCSVVIAGGLSYEAQERAARRRVRHDKRLPSLYHDRCHSAVRRSQAGSTTRKVLMLYRNATRAFVAELAEIRSAGDPVTGRGKSTHELLARSVTLANPTERFITVPGRRNDVFATLAETMWVLAGRNDMEFLSRYLERAKEFSDDKVTWRGGYGPRLRNWSRVDQLDEIRKLLSAIPESRRAVAVLFDPTKDFTDTLDVPCNNWLHFLLRRGRLDLNVTVRSNDILWGFSGINTFEWSVLQEMMAFWLGNKVGQCSFFISSLHLYDERTEQADRTLAAFRGATGYEQGWGSARFETRWEDFPSALERWFDIEARLARGQDLGAEIADFRDPLLRQFLQVIAIKWAIEVGADERRQHELVNALGHSDVTLALHEQLFRDSAALLDANQTPVDWAEIRESVIALHRSKDAAYGNSWKKRGELISIAANLARKIDRIEQVTNGAAAGNEALLDTAVDLLVYAIKYETFLADQSREISVELFARWGERFSDGPAGFEELLRAREIDGEVSTVQDEAESVISAFSQLDAFLRQNPYGEWSEKLHFAQQLSSFALRLVVAISAVDWEGVEALEREARRS